MNCPYCGSTHVSEPHELTEKFEIFGMAIRGVLRQCLNCHKVFNLDGTAISILPGSGLAVRGL